MSERKAILSTLVAALAVVAVGVVAIYVFGNRQGNTTPEVASTRVITGPAQLAAATPEQAANCERAPAAAARLDALAVGDLAAFRINTRPISLAALDFQGEDGTPLTIADFAGRTILLNLWATWCVPCRAEMPALDRLQQQLGGDDFAVVAVSLDASDVSRPRGFLDEIAVGLDLYVDPRLGLLDDIRRIGAMGGLPTTILIDAAGCQLGILEGPAEWDSPAAVRLITAAIEDA
ncbi:MAG: TlpA family protein disulfide reductase [Bauldia sp.]|nr:TlpA family protein disulfide reductase [Bauldia sp.]MCW5716193.1 TlpA family protein disulfide reductase [Bauldia sp.]